MLKKVKSDPSLFADCASPAPHCVLAHAAPPRPSLARGAGAKMRRRVSSAPCFARYAARSAPESRPSIGAIIECKAKMVIFLALSIANQGSVGNALTAVDAAMEVRRAVSGDARGPGGAKDAVRRIFTRMATDVLLYMMIGADDAFHYLLCLVLAERARRLMEP